MDVLVVDAANVVGSRPDGWWRDRLGAAERLVTALAAACEAALAPWQVVVVLEGRARTACPDGAAGLMLVRAPGSGDDTVVAVVAEREHGGCEVTVVTSDRELRRRVEALGAGVRGASWLRDLVDGVDRDQPPSP